MRTDGGREYWANQGLQAEYRALLGGGAEPAGDASAESAAPAGAGAGES
jgi:hypothetical protein